MAMTDCTVKAGVSASARGVFPPQGVTGSNNNTVITQDGNTQITSLTYGTTSGKVDLITVSDRTINAASSATYDLYTGTDLKDLDGLTCAFRKVKYIEVMIVSGGDTSGVVVGNAAADAWASFFGAATHTHTIFPSGPPYLGGSPAGVAVGTTTKNLKVANAGAVAVTVRVFIAGTSA